jgi:hypothetical protein
MNKWMMKYLEERGVMSEEEKKTFRDLLDKYERLIRGESLKNIE